MVRQSAWKKTKSYMRRMRKAGGWIAILLLFIIFDNVSANSDTNSSIEYRLPGNVIPISYDIKFTILDLVTNNFTFKGESKVHIKIIYETYNITLHAYHDLKIHENVTTLMNGSSIKPKSHKRDNITDFLTLNFDDPIKPGNYSLMFEFIGNISKESVGIYRTSHLNNDNEKIWIITTRFSPTKARRAFPCWDEPALKATFNISICHNGNYIAGSNMPVKSILSLKHKVNDVKGLTIFETTPVMSTYLVSFILTDDFNCMLSENKLLNMCSNKKSLSNMKFAQEVGKKAIPFLTRYTDIPFSLPKLDHYAIPEGGMENWGLITYREINIFVNSNTSDAIKENIGGMFLHELSQQWFGNLVSPAWWKYSWIKEGLSNYFQYYIGNKLFPEWDYLNTFIARILQYSTFSMDGTTYHNYLNWNPRNPAEIKSHLSIMSNHKGAVVMYMLNNILGDETFQKGVRNYLKKHQFGVATSDDFWNAMQVAYDTTEKDGNLKIKELMEPWIEKKGYPVVKVIRDYENGKAILNQTSNLPSEPSNRWYIPINYLVESNLFNYSCGKPTHWLKPNDQSLIIDGLKKEDWLIVNVKQIGYYRVDYDPANWKKISDYLNTDNYNKISVLNRGQIINDVFYMVFNDRQNISIFFELTKYLSREVDLIPWRHAIKSFRGIKRKIFDENLEKDLKKYVVNLLKKVVDEVGFEELPTDSYMMKKKRAEILPFACEYGHTDCLNAASKKLLAYLENPVENPIPPNLDDWVFCFGMSPGKIETILQEGLEKGEQKYFTSLGCAKNKTFLRHYIETALSDTNISIPKNNVRIALSRIALDGDKNFDYAVDYFIKNYDRIKPYFNKSVVISSILNDYIWLAPSIDRIKKISEFVDKNHADFLTWVKRNIDDQTEKLEYSKKNAEAVRAMLKELI